MLACFFVFKQAMQRKEGAVGYISNY